MHTVADIPSMTLPRLPVRTVRWTRPFVWLGRACGDLYHSFAASLTHGLGMTVLGWMLLFILGAHPYLVIAAVTGFLLVAPLMATGVCELSRRLETGERAGLDESFAPLRRDGPALFHYGIVLAVGALAWLLISELALSTVLHLGAPSFSNAFWLGIAQDITPERLVAYAAVGALLALLVFSVSVVTVPVIIARHGNASQAIRTSLEALRRNPGTLLVWAALIVVLTAIGFATALVGMIVIIPLLGHATWRAYRDLVAA
ncbi:MAG: DUF2189 domain-containing protein [Proteobacteria bacterium]|nr:DUF2189 domain-containing protein [Pseudomonadota bacterium]